MSAKIKAVSRLSSMNPFALRCKVGGTVTPSGLKVGIIVAISIGFTVIFVGPDHRILKAMGFATAREVSGCKQGDPLRTLVILGVAAVTIGFLAIRPGLKKFMAAVVATGIGFFAYTKRQARGC